MARHVRLGTALLHRSRQLAHQSRLRVMNSSEVECAVQRAQREETGWIVPALPARLTARALVCAHRFVIDDGHAVRFDDGEERTEARDLRPHGAAAIEV